MNTDHIQKLIKWILWPSIGALSLTILALILSLYVYLSPVTDVLVEQTPQENLSKEEMQKRNPEIIDGIHIETGLKEGEGLQAVITNCTNCHSARLIVQNRMTADRWRHTIRWMQRTQNLWELGENEDLIVNYLAANYAPEKKGRRTRLTNIEWYVLEQ